MKLQFISRVTAEPGARGNAAYMLDVMAGLERAGIAVEFVLLETPGAPQAPTWDGLPTPAERALARRRMAAGRPDAVMVNYMHLAEILEDAPAGARRVILTHDVCCLRGECFRAAGAKLDGACWDRAAEAGLLARADLLVAIQAVEADALRELAPGCEVVLAPFSMAPRDPVGAPAPGRCLFVGSDADHNRFSLLWFLDEVWPLVLAARPDAELSVCGTVNHRIRREFPRVALRGRVADLAPEYGAAEAVIVPLRVGSGLEIKLVEAMGYGRPCVVSSRGLAALPAGCREAVLAGEDAPAFAAALLRLLGDAALRQSVAARARACVAAHFSPETAHRALAAALLQGRS